MSPTEPSAPPFGTLEYLYMGTKDAPRDAMYYRDALGATIVWDMEGMGARVVAVRIGAGPLVLLADHRPPKTCLPLYSVKDLKDVAKRLRKRGWRPLGRPFEIPNGPCYLFEDPSGNEFGFFQDDRPRPFEGTKTRDGRPRGPL